MNKTIRIGTRKSALAMVQTELVAEALKRVQPGLETRIVTKVTEGDRILNKPLLEFGGKGVFVTEFEQALQNGEIDFAVHSAKDLPMDLEDRTGDRGRASERGPERCADDTGRNRFKREKGDCYRHLQLKAKAPDRDPGKEAVARRSRAV